MLGTAILQLRLLFTFFFSFIAFSIYGSLPTVIVSLAPYQFFVNQIAEDTVDVFLIVPPGASSHTYEPTPRQVMQASQALLWFSIGESFEARAMQALKSYHSNLKVVDLQQNLDLISQPHCHQGCCAGAFDLHFWLSARQAQIQASTIANALISSFPQHKEKYLSNLKKLQGQLQDLDREIKTILAPLKQRSLLVGHPAYGYFCRDYHLQQYSVEIEGKDPSAKQLTNLLLFARGLGTKTIFVQPQYSNKAAWLVAKDIGAKLVTLDPYSQNYMQTMLTIAQAFAAQ